MGFGGISIWQLLIILVIIVLLFGTKRLRNIGSDLGSAIRGFRSSLKDNEPENSAETDATFPEVRKEVASNQSNAAPTAPTSTTATPAQTAANNNTNTEKH